MKPDDVVRAFYQAVDAEGPEQAAIRYLSPQVRFDSEGEPPRVGREAFLARHAMFAGSFPDLHDAPTIERVDGSIVYGTDHVTGTHTGDLDLTAAGMGVISATNRRVSLTIDVAWTIVDDQITRMSATTPQGPLVPLVLRQLGALPPT